MGVMRLVDRLVLVLCLAMLVAGGPLVAAEPAGQPASTRANGDVTRPPQDIADLKILERAVQKTIAQVSPSVVCVARGSGVVISEDGYVLTVAHIAQHAGRNVVVTFPNGKRAQAITLGNDHGVDAGMVKITDKGPWPHVAMGDSTAVQPGQWCLTLGYPATFQHGQLPVARIGQVLRNSRREIITDCTIMGGDSGAPLFDLEGKVIGIGSMCDDSLLYNIHVPMACFGDGWEKLLKGEDFNSPAGNDADGPHRPPQRGHGHRGPARGKNDAGIKSVFQEALQQASAATVRILGDGREIALGAVVDRDGYLVTKASLLTGKITCRFRDGTEKEATLVGKDDRYDLALLRVKAANLPALSWREGGPPPPGTLVATSAAAGDPLAIGVVSADLREIRNTDNFSRRRAWLGVELGGGEEGRGVEGVAPHSPAATAGVRPGDEIVKIDGAAMKSADQIIETVLGHAAAETIKLSIHRKDADADIPVALAKPVEPEDEWGGGPFSERRAGFPLVLPHDTPLLPKDCGGPLLDTDGRAVGINIARALRVITYALPASVVREVVSQLKAKGATGGLGAMDRSHSR